MPRAREAADRHSMAFARRLLPALLAVALVLAAACALPARADAAGPRTTATWRFCGGCAERGGDLARYGYVGLNADQTSRVPAIVAGGGQALVYKDMASTRSWSCGPLPSGGLDYCTVDREHPEWFTLDAGGARMEWAGYPGVWQMDVGAPAYQDAWADAVLAELRAHGWSGVVIDNANVDTDGYLAGRTPREYPTQASYQAATRSFLARVCPRVIAAGFLCLPNIQANPVRAGAELWADWTQFTSGGVREYWVKWGSDSNGLYGDGGWDDLQRVAEMVQAAGKIFLPVTYAPMSDVRSIRWGRANFLLTWNGGPSAFVFAPAPEAQDPWSPEWGTEIGQPVGPRVQVGGVWRREYTGGTVLVNRSSSAATVELGAAYAQPDGAKVTSVTLAALSGLVLARVGAPTETLNAPPPADGTFRVNVEATVVAAAPAPEQLSAAPARPAPTVEVSGRVSAEGEAAAGLARSLREGRGTAVVEGKTKQGWRRLGVARIGADGRFKIRRVAQLRTVRVVARVAQKVARSGAVPVG